MIIVKLWGGMCNQMFQYAFGYSLSKKYNDDLGFDVDFYKSQPNHVGKRNTISNDDFSLTKLNFVERPKVINFFENKYLNHVIRHSTGCNLPLQDIQLVIEKHFKFYQDVPYKKGKINFYDGYWQSAAYSEQFRDELLKEFTPKVSVKEKVSLWRNKYGSSPLVAVHIRRGDYLNKENQKTIENVIGRDYYIKAMQIMEERIPNAKFCFFSDDIEWCKSQFVNNEDKFVYAENKGPEAALIDLFSMAACDHEIMSPSTFSWFGNWLRNKDKESLVICPDVYDKKRNVLMPGWILV